MSWQAFEPAREHLAWTDEIECTSSEFALSSVPIRYFLANVRLSALENLFSLVEDIPGSSHWGYDAIFQRDIDDERVDKELLQKYLLRHNKFKFFNPLTIALLPWNAKDNKVREQYLHADPGQTVEYDGGMRKELLVGGVEVQSLEGTSVGKIRWDRHEVKGVAIDGQHRLSALMKYARHPERPPGVDPYEAKIPVALLVFDAETTNVLAQVREIFVDINKNAEPVSTSRRILLDDRDPFAVLTRDLISDQRDSEGLRYEVVDWKRETPRPEGGNQLTTTVVLYEVVKRILSVGAGGSPATRLASVLDLNSELSRQNVLPIPVDDENFGLNDMSEKQIEVARQRFRLKHKKVILRLFEDLPPYKSFLELVSSFVDKDSEESELLREYIFKPSKKREAFKEDIRASGYDPVAVVDRPFKAMADIKQSATGAELLFYSVGQQALFFDLPKVRKLYSECGYGSLDEVAEQYLEDLSLLIANGFFSRRMSVRLDANSKSFEIWRRICIRQGKVAPGQASVKRISELLVLVLCAMRHGHTEHFDQAPVNLRPNINHIREEYEKEWDERLETTQYLSEDDSSVDEDEDDFTEDDLTDDDAKELAMATIVRILQLAHSWRSV